MRPTRLFGAALFVLLVGASASAEGLQSPSQLRTHSLYTEVVSSSFQETTLKSFASASLVSEWVSTSIIDGGAFAAMKTTTRGTDSLTLDRIRIDFANNLDSEILAATRVRFSLAQDALFSIGGLIPGGTEFIGEQLIELHSDRGSVLVSTLENLEDTVALEANVTYDLTMDISRNTFTEGSWGSWFFDIEYAQSVPVPSPAGLAILAGSCLARRRRR